MPASSQDSARLVDSLRSVLAAGDVLTDPKATRRFRQGIRCGEGAALAVVRPRSLVEQWRALEACVAARAVVIVQAANTGLTGGSTPNGSDYDRPVVIVNTMHIAGIHVIDEGRQVICLPGAALHELERVLAPYRRQPHSVIGSSCIGASVIGGICNNSGGALVQRGPAYTQMALFARLAANGRLTLVNHLGVRLGDRPEPALARLERGAFGPADVDLRPVRWGSNRAYASRVRDVDADEPARFNAHEESLFEASGCAGKLMVFAVRLDTFPADAVTRVFYIGTHSPAELTAIRRHVLTQFTELPVAGEYLHRRMFDIAARYGKDTFLIIRWLGTRRLPAFFAWKRRIDELLAKVAPGSRISSERVLQRLGSLLPDHIPERMMRWRNRFEHHLLLKMADSGIAEAEAYLRSLMPSASGDFFECSGDEADAAFLHRFVAAGAAMRYRALHDNEVEDILALDVALKRSDRDWFETLPGEVRAQIHSALYYGHFFCHVFHQDYIVRKGVDVTALKRRLLELLDSRGAEYPAEHNVGHLYDAKPALADFYRELDPCNQFNPGIGRTSKAANWEES